MTEEDNLPKILPPKNDIVFKMLFGDQRNEKTLIALLEAVLEKKINKVQLLNPINKQKNEDDKAPQRIFNVRERRIVSV